MKLIQAAVLVLSTLPFCAYQLQFIYLLISLQTSGNAPYNPSWTRSKHCLGDAGTTSACRYYHYQCMQVLAGQPLQGPHVQRLHL
jgi:hypothetical protein